MHRLVNTLNQQEDVMSKKMLKKKVQHKSAVQVSAAPMVESAREIWLAGLGAFNVAQQESGRILEQGSKLFEKLVAEGSKIEHKTRKDVVGAIGDIRGEVESRVEVIKHQADAVRKQANDNWDKLERIFEDRVARALSRLGIPSKEDVSGLADKVQKLAREVSDLDGKKAAAKPRVKVMAKSKKAAAKKVAVKQPAAGNVVRKKVAKKAA
jgi:poly(hydroxyalkanoate) granule-associated protein